MVEGRSLILHRLVVALVLDHIRRVGICTAATLNCYNQRAAQHLQIKELINTGAAHKYGHDVVNMGLLSKFVTP